MSQLNVKIVDKKDAVNKDDAIDVAKERGKLEGSGFEIIFADDVDHVYLNFEGNGKEYHGAWVIIGKIKK